MLFRHYVAQAAEQSGLRAPEVTPQIVAGLMARDWPGNARALMSEAMRFVMGMSEADVDGCVMGLVEQLAQVEQSLIEAALRARKGQASDAARALKLPRKTFYDKWRATRFKPKISALERNDVCGFPHRQRSAVRYSALRRIRVSDTINVMLRC